MIIMKPKKKMIIIISSKKFDDPYDMFIEVLLKFWLNCSFNPL